MLLLPLYISMQACVSYIGTWEHRSSVGIVEGFSSSWVNEIKPKVEFPSHGKIKRHRKTYVSMFSHVLHLWVFSNSVFSALSPENKHVRFNCFFMTFVRLALFTIKVASCFFSCAIAGILFRKRKRRSWPAASSIRDNLSTAGNAAKWQGPWSHHFPRSCPTFFCPEKPETMKNRGRGRWRGSYLLNAQKIVVRELDGERAWSKEPFVGLSGREEALEEGGRGRQ